MGTYHDIQPRLQPCRPWHAIGRTLRRSDAGEVFPKSYRRREHELIARALRDRGHLLDAETRARVEADLIRKAPR
jgi:hypothetical protein